MDLYRVLTKQVFTKGQYSITPFRIVDKYDIMNWRNEQVYHLRQNKLLSVEDQDKYFETVIKGSFNEEFPSQILFSFLKGSECVGYGGLVHINWTDRNAEISFLMNTSLETDYFEEYWGIFLGLIQEVSFEELGFHKIFTYAFNLRPRLYNALEDSGFAREAELKEHCFFDKEFISVIIHSKINNYALRLAKQNDVGITFDWATSDQIRRFSFNKGAITHSEHSAWFEKKLLDPNCIYLLLENCLNTAVGSIRIELVDGVGTISYLISDRYHGRGLGAKIIRLLAEYIRVNQLKIDKLVGYVMPENIASVKIFKKSGFIESVDGNNLKFEKELI